MYKQIIFQVVLIMINAFFAMTEVALISTNKIKLKKMADEGDNIAKKLVDISEDPSEFLSTIQIGITFANFIASAFAADGLSGYLADFIYNTLNVKVLSYEMMSTASLILITIILSYFTLVLGELVPKRIAMQKPMEVARFACIPVSAISTVVKPAVKFLSLSTNVVLKGLRIDTNEEEDSITEEEIRMMLEIGNTGGTINSDEKEWIDNVFDFSDSSVREIMTHKSEVVGIYEDDSLSEIEEKIHETGYSRYPVYGENDNDIKGILYSKDFFAEVYNCFAKEDDDLGVVVNKNELNIMDNLRKPYFIPDSMSSLLLFKNMQKNNTHIAIVINEYGENIGLITMEDLLEEIVGNIYDEYDECDDEDVKISETTWKIKGSTSLDDLSDKFDIDFPDDLDYDTISGLILEKIQRIPNDGEKFEIEAFGMKIKVEKVEARKIEEVIITII
ncbi:MULTISPECIES: hemolysin family protein [Peptostreptococcales]|uniref:hemolysin family protein n=1 Tax=Peptostreptococcales TaxID=3082720 RepID=UPI000E4D3214|nr:hemolysin family protein [Peptoclostridium sp. AF21-18]RHQ99845.1 HlyC/CorC family transporter [Peptoclostridium sp. AF21-18]